MPDGLPNRYFYMAKIIGDFLLYQISGYALYKPAERSHCVYLQTTGYIQLLLPYKRYY